MFVCCPVIYDDPAKRMIYYMHQMCMDILWYIEFDVFKWPRWLGNLHTLQEAYTCSLEECLDTSSDNPAEWFSCYLHHKNMDVLQYVCAHVPSGYYGKRKTYYICHIHIDELQYVRDDVASDYAET